MSRNILQNTQFQTPNTPSTTIRTNSYIKTTYTQLFTNPLNIPPNPSNTPTYNTVPRSTQPNSRVSNPTYINSSTSISEPIEPFDGLDTSYAPEEYLQHTEARVTFSLADHENKFWHVRRVAFIQCSLTGTALSWYIRLNDTYNQDWPAFVQALKKQFSSQKHSLCSSRSPLIQLKMKQFVILHLKFNN